MAGRYPFSVRAPGPSDLHLCPAVPSGGGIFYDFRRQVSGRDFLPYHKMIHQRRSHAASSRLRSSGRPHTFCRTARPCGGPCPYRAKLFLRTAVPGRRRKSGLAYGGRRAESPFPAGKRRYRYYQIRSQPRPASRRKNIRSRPPDPGCSRFGRHPTGFGPDRRS